MILLDSSVLIDALRKPDPKLQQLIQANQGAVCGVIRAEILHGARDANHYQQLQSSLATFPQLPIPDSLWDMVGANLFALRTQGVSVPFNDAILATIAIENDVELWTRDAQFKMIQVVLAKLKLFQEPP